MPATATLAASLATALVFASGLSSAQGQLGSGQPVGQFHLCADGVGQVGYNQHILDVIVATVDVSIRYQSSRNDHLQVTLDISRVNLWRQCESVEEELAQCCRRWRLLIDDCLDVS